MLDIDQLKAIVETAKQLKCALGGAAVDVEGEDEFMDEGVGALETLRNMRHEAQMIEECTLGLISGLDDS